MQKIENLSDVVEREWWENIVRMKNENGVLKERENGIINEDRKWNVKVEQKSGRKTKEIK